MKRILWLAIFLFFAPALLAQNSITVSISVTDLGGQAWVNGTYTANFVGPTNVTWPGGTVPQSVSGSLSATGTATQALANNNTITPSPTFWTFTVCPAAGVSSGCFITASIAITTPAQAVAITPPAISIAASSANSPIGAYNDAEITSNAFVGALYYNVLSLSVKVCQAVSGTTCSTWGSGGSAGTTQGSKALFVDGNRTDTYTQTGSFAQPFKTIMGAVNQVITNGDNASVCYLINIAPGNYNELIVLENLALNCLVFDGHESAILTGASAGIRSQVNNNNLIGANLTGIGVVFLHFPAISPGGTFAFTFQNSATQWEVRECTWSLNSFALSASAAQPQLNVYDSILQIGTLTVNSAFMGFFNSSHAAGGTLAITNTGNVGYNRGSRNSGTNATVDATSTLALSGGARMDGTVTDNGSLLNRQGVITGAITVNSGGTYSEPTGAHTGTLTVNAGGIYTPSGSLAIGIASGTVAMPTASIGSGACSAAATGTVTTGLASTLSTTDTVAYSFSAGLPGINPGELVISATIPSNGSTPTFQYCNETGASVTPVATTLNWKVVR